MNEDVKALWVEALESGEYAQGKHQLRRGNDTFCCLGVLCDLAVRNGIEIEVSRLPVSGGYEYDGSVAFLPEAVKKWAGTRGKFVRLMDMNDSGKKFKTIAKYIKENL